MGKSKKHQVCPVTNAEMNSRECGSGRISRYACPEECPRNPWSVESYEKMLQTEDALMRIASTRLFDDEKRSGATIEHPPSAQGHSLELLGFFFERFFCREDPQGQTFYQRWEAAGWEGLNNDQCTLFRLFSRFSPVLLEVQQVLDDRRIIVINRLERDPTPFLLIDRCLAYIACRFMIVLGVLIRLPHYTRLHGAAVEIRPIGMRRPEEILDIVLKHLKIPASKETRNRWICFNLHRVRECLDAVAQARRQDALRLLDATRCTSVYRVSDGLESEFISIMDGHPDIHDNDEDDGDEETEFSWIWASDDTLPSRFGVTVLGHVHMDVGGKIRLVATSVKRSKELREKFEGLMGDRVQFEGGQVLDIARELRQQTEPFDESLVPRKLLKNPDRLDMRSTRLEMSSTGDSVSEALSELDRIYADTPVPALKNKTPRQAAGIPALRPVLIELMKQQVRLRDQQNLEGGTCIDINPLIEDLGLDEINFPPPPRVQARAALMAAEMGHDEVEDMFCDGSDGSHITPEIIEQVDAFLAKLPPGSVVSCGDRTCPELKGFLEEICTGYFPGESKLLDRLWHLVGRTICMFFDPFSSDLPRISWAMILLCISDEIDAMKAYGKQYKPVACREPEVLMDVIKELSTFIEIKGNEMGCMILVIVFSVFINALDDAWIDQE